MSESCNSRHFTWLVKSCLPNPNDTTITGAPATTISAAKTTSPFFPNDISAAITTLSSLPDDIVLECISRVPSSSIQPLSLVCRRWRRLVLSASFLRLRRQRCLLRHSLFALSASDSAIFSASLPFPETSSEQWKLSAFVQNDSASSSPLPSHARICSVGPTVFIVGRSSALRYDSWTGTVTAMSPTVFPRKKFAFAEVSGKIYVAGGGGPSTTAVEEYDPETDRWRVVTNAPRSRYGCIGASADGVFYIIGGLKLGGGACAAAESSRAEAHVYAGSMDLYDVHARTWIRSRAVPGGGCVVAACAAAGRVYVLASHAVELSFWSFDGRRRGGCGGGFGEWRRIKSPPLPAQVRVDGFVRFSCAGVGEKVVLVQASGCIDDLLRRSGRSGRGMREGLVLVYDPAAEEWTRAPDLPEVIRRAACVGVEC